MRMRMRRPIRHTSACIATTSKVSLRMMPPPPPPTGYHAHAGASREDSLAQVGIQLFKSNKRG